MTVAEFSPSQRKSKKVLARLWVLVYSYFSRHAGLAQLVARHLAKVEVAGSNPVARSMNCRRSTNRSAAFFVAREALRFLPRVGDRREPRSTVVAVSGSRLEPISVSTAVPGSCLKPTLPRPAALWNTVGRGNVGSVPAGNTAGGWDMGSIPRVDTAMRIDVGFKLRFRADHPCSAPREDPLPKIFSDEFEIWACARPAVPVYYPLRLRA